MKKEHEDIFSRTLDDPKALEIISMEASRFIREKREEMYMEKYGVDTGQQPGEKTASASWKCPICGSSLNTYSPTPSGPTLGTEPFEKKSK